MAKNPITIEQVREVESMCAVAWAMGAVSPEVYADWCAMNDACTEFAHNGPVESVAAFIAQMPQCNARTGMEMVHGMRTWESHNG